MVFYFVEVVAIVPCFMVRGWRVDISLLQKRTPFIIERGEPFDELKHFYDESLQIFHTYSHTISDERKSLTAIAIVVYMGLLLNSAMLVAVCGATVPVSLFDFTIHSRSTRVSFLQLSTSVFIHLSFAPKRERKKGTHQQQRINKKKK